MKLYRFIAEDNHKAMMKVQESLGPDALIYSTKKVETGIEILAGIAQRIANVNDAEEVEIDNKLPKRKVPEQELAEALTSQFKKNDINIKNLSVSINVFYQIMTDTSEEKSSSWAEMFKSSAILNFFKSFRKNIVEGVYGRQAAH